MRIWLTLLAGSSLLLFLDRTGAFVRPSLPKKHRHVLFANSPKQQQQQDESKQKRKQRDDEEDMNPLTKASWYAVEAFGKVFGSKKTVEAAADGDDVRLDQPPQSLRETLQRIQLDNDRAYFLSGQVDKLIYDDQCVFSDPFVSFAGRDRFVDNLANLGSFITKYSAKMLNYAVEETTVTTKVMVKLELNLPWKPILAWPWGVTYQIDPETFLIKTHKETWDIEPWEGVKQIFRKPTLKIE